MRRPCDIFSDLLDRGARYNDARENESGKGGCNNEIPQGTRSSWLCERSKNLCRLLVMRGNDIVAGGEEECYPGPGFPRAMFFFAATLPTHVPACLDLRSDLGTNAKKLKSHV